MTATVVWVVERGDDRTGCVDGVYATREAAVARMITADFAEHWQAVQHNHPSEARVVSWRNEDLGGRGWLTAKPYEVAS
jgi:hypothetical protein